MNRLSPLIARRADPFAAPLAGKRSSGKAGAAVDPLADLKLFATGWIGGLVFFGTLFA